MQTIERRRLYLSTANLKALDSLAQTLETTPSIALDKLLDSLLKREDLMKSFRNTGL